MIGDDDDDHDDDVYDNNDDANSDDFDDEDNNGDVVASAIIELNVVRLNYLFFLQISCTAATKLLLLSPSYITQKSSSTDHRGNFFVGLSRITRQAVVVISAV